MGKLTKLNSEMSVRIDNLLLYYSTSNSFLNQCFLNGNGTGVYKAFIKRIRMIDVQAKKSIQSGIFRVQQTSFNTRRKNQALTTKETER